jgi:hypothetical protein
LGAQDTCRGKPLPAFAAEVVSRLTKRPEGIRIKHRVGSNHLKALRQRGVQPVVHICPSKRSEESLTSRQRHSLKPPFAHLEEVSLTSSQFQFGIRDLFTVNLDPTTLN